MLSAQCVYPRDQFPHRARLNSVQDRNYRSGATMAETPEHAGWLLPYAKARATLRERYWRSLWIRARIIGRFASDCGVLKRLGDNHMKIRIIGAGKVGGGLGKLWVRAGHQVLFSSRHPKRLRVLVEEAGPGAYFGAVGDAALFGA